MVCYCPPPLPSLTHPTPEQNEDKDSKDNDKKCEDNEEKDRNDEENNKDNYDKGNYNKDNKDNRCQLPGFSQTYHSCLNLPFDWM